MRQIEVQGERILQKKVKGVQGERILQKKVKGRMRQIEVQMERILQKKVKLLPNILKNITNYLSD